MRNIFYKIKSKIKKSCITASSVKLVFSETRDILTAECRDMKLLKMNLGASLPSENYEDPNNQKTTFFNAALEDLNWSNISAYHLLILYQLQNQCQVYLCKSLGAVEVAGIEPASLWMVGRDSNQSTPTASLL